MLLETSRTPTDSGVAAEELDLRWLRLGGRRLLALAAIGLIFALLLARPLLAAFYLSIGSQALLQAQQGADSSLQRARSALERASELAPANPLTHRRLAQAALLAGRPAESVAALERAYALQPDSPLIRNDLVRALVASDAPRAGELLASAPDLAAELHAASERLLGAGDLPGALELYRALLAGSEAPDPLMQVRAGLIAATLGDHAAATSFLHDSGAPQIPDLLASDLVRGQSDIAATWGALLVNGEPVSLASSPLYVAHGSGWYGAEPNTGRWVRSPATILVFSPVARAAEMAYATSLLADPAAPDGLTNMGTLLLRLNNGQAQQIPLVSHERSLVALQLSAGWNVIEIALAAGNIKPSQINPEAQDPRELSMAVLQADFVVE